MGVARDMLYLAPEASAADESSQSVSEKFRYDCNEGSNNVKLLLWLGSGAYLCIGAWKEGVLS